MRLRALNPNLAVSLYLSESLDYHLSIHSFVVSLKLNFDFRLLNFAFGINLEYSWSPSIVTLYMVVDSIRTSILNSIRKVITNK